MDSAKLNDWMQVVGIFAVVASLVFVGLQMRQEQEIAIVATYGMLVESTENIADLIDRNAEIWQQGLDGAELSSTDRIKFLALVKAVQTHLSGIYIRWLRIGPGNPDYVTRAYAFALYTYPGLLKARAQIGKSMVVGDVPYGGIFLSRRMEREVNDLLEEFGEIKPPLPTEKTYIFW
jgi:hypothetical protein